MFGTIIMDSYKSDEVELMSQYIDDLCSPMDLYGWASAGIYSFWDYYTKEILYIGLASDLYVRFRQHNGLLPISENACKFKQIRSYFPCMKDLGIQSWCNRLYPSRLFIEIRNSIKIF